ncbi:MAG: hypothetical protein J6Z14_00065 [Prevotella sp.]|nr:hypothetical protein [Prevotella sp.]
MTVHIFNPEHDLALAANLANFTAPHAGRQLRYDLGFLPALWAAEGDVVLTDNQEQAERMFRKVATAARKHLGLRLGDAPEWVPTDRPTDVLRRADALSPWGWDAALVARLRRLGVADATLPDDGRLAQIRELSHRRTAARLLPLLGECGDTIVRTAPTECHTQEEVAETLQRYGRAVVKAPWSSSGRGIRFVGPDHSPQVFGGWLRNVLAQQGSVMVEPYYNKVKDFGMEFTTLADGTLAYGGLSLFHTQNGAYTGNILATEAAKREMMSRYVSPDLLDKVKESICRCLPPLLQGHYQGPLGVDMMVCAGPISSEKFLLHPCVEINLRRTMGHVALTLSPADDEVVGVMRIACTGGRYQMDITRNATCRN